jgi:hypothetical protein
MAAPSALLLSPSSAFTSGKRGMRFAYSTALTKKQAPTAVRARRITALGGTVLVGGMRGSCRVRDLGRPGCR